MNLCIVNSLGLNMQWVKNEVSIRCNVGCGLSLRVVRNF